MSTPNRNPDRVVSESDCCPDAKVRYSESCHARYCEKCDTWLDEPWIEPVALGPTWKRDPETGKFIAPKHSLGPAIVAWVAKYVNSPDGNGPWKFTPEQLRFIYWLYAIDERGRFIYREATMQRVKGAGKDPLAAVLSLIEMLGPCRFASWDSDGRPIARDESAAWITVAAVARAQTRNTMALFPTLVSPRMKAQYGVNVGKEQVVALGGARTILAVTSSPQTMEGNRPTFQIANEVHLWRDNNNGHEMRKVMARNAAKIQGGQSRILSITNAYNPSEMSVGQANREGWEMAQTGEFVDTGVMYDSLEAPEGARMIAREIPVVLEAVRGDAKWLDIERITQEILDPRNPVSTSRRFYFNQIGADDEAWVDPRDVDATIAEQVKKWRADPDIETDSLRLGWAPVGETEPIVVFFDGGKTDDHTAISGCRISDGYTFAIGHWGRPPNLDDRQPWFAPRTEVDNRMVEAMTRFRVVAIWGDPSHAKDDEDDTPYWDGLLDTWHRRWKEDLQLWAVKTGEGVHSVKWDMTSPARQATFVAHAERFQQDMVERTIEHDGHPMFVRYMKNAKGLQTRYGTSLWKGARGSKRKIDGAVTHVGARMLRDLFLNREEREEKKEPQRRGVWGDW